MTKNWSAQLALFNTRDSAGEQVVVVQQRLPRANHREEKGLSVCVLGSGSGGNSTVARFGSRCLLIDAGFGPRTTAKRLAQAGLTLPDLDAICVTHLDTDHFRPSWVALLADLGIPLWLHRWHAQMFAELYHAAPLIDAGLIRAFDDDEPFLPFEDDCVRGGTIRLQHDRQGTTGYRFDFTAGDHGFGGAVAYATDLGHVPQRLIDHFRGADILCLEANYDEHMTIHSSRPSWVNRRNMSDSGHLSNEQSLEAVRAIDAMSPEGCPQHVVLLHRSAQCNHEMKLRRVFEQHPSIYRRVTLTDQRRRTRWLHARPRPATQRHQQHFHAG